MASFALQKRHTRQREAVSNQIGHWNQSPRITASSFLEYLTTKSILLLYWT